MKFSKNRLYIEKYTKCPNCGILIFEAATRPGGEAKAVGDKLYCSDWCVTWEAERDARWKAEAAAS